MRHDKIRISNEVDFHELVCNIIGSLDHDQIVEFIKELDSDCEDWDMTLELCTHFAILKEEYDKETLLEDNE